MGVTEKMVYTLLTAAVTVGMLNGFWPHLPGGTCSADNLSGLPAELVANCTGIPEGQPKPTYCSQKYVGTISLATQELQSALHSYNMKHNSAIEEARREVVDFYEVRTAELAGTIETQQATITGLQGRLRGMEDQLTARKIELNKINTEYRTIKDVAAASEKEAKALKAKLGKFEEQLYSAMEELSATSEALSNRTATVKALEGNASKLERALSKSEATVAKLQGKVTKLTETGEEGAKKLAGVEVELSSSQAEAKKLREVKAGVEMELKNARGEQGKQASSIKELSARVEGLMEQVKQAGAQLKAVSAERDAKAKRVTELEKQVGGMQEGIKALEAEKGSMRSGLAAKVEEVKSLRGRIAELEGKMRQQQDVMQAEQAKWEKEKQALFGKLERARQLFDGFVAHNTKVQSLLLRLQQFLRSEVATIMEQTDEAVEQSRPGSMDSMINELRSQLSV